MQVDAFQINDLAILTVKDGEELVCSGMYSAREIEPGIMEVDFFEAGKGRVTVARRNDDPEKVGAVEGQKRYFWSGELN